LTFILAKAFNGKSTFFVRTLTPRKKYTRGYAVAVLIGLESNYAYLWQVFSKVAKPTEVIRLDGSRSDSKVLYNFHQSIVNSLRPTLKEGIRSLILASPPRTNYAQDFIAHIRRHHAWLSQGENKIAIAEITGFAATPTQVAQLVNSSVFRELISEATSEEAENLLALLEKRLNMSDREGEVLFSLKEAEGLILYSSKTSTRKAEYLLLTDAYLACSRHKNRLNRLLQIAANLGVKTRVVNAESPAGARLTQLGGFVCLAKSS
jgi:stalled ribosome rescue protein Dom34